VYVIHLAKEPFKFSCSHFTILSSEHAERLHGHNYQVRADIGLKTLDPKLGLAFDFNLVKPMIRQVCDDMDERILLPARSPYLQLQSDADNVHVVFAKKKYSFPLDDTLCLPLVNITCEELARYFHERLSAAMQTVDNWTSLSVQVEETRGQSVSFSAPR
jgi:6-pyruvoyltetrahydropterin/6-carboxytetrahydropterin synthase